MAIARRSMFRIAMLAAIAVWPADWSVLAFESVSPPIGDHATLKNGSKIRGIVVERSDKSILMLTSANWLSLSNGKQFESSQPKSVAGHRAGLEQLVRRLEAMPLANNAGLAAFWKQQLADARTQLAEADEYVTEFLWVTISLTDIARPISATPEQRQLLVWAWAERLDRPENWSVHDAAKELKARRVSPIGWPLSWIERLPARDQSDAEWAARRAIVEYAHSERLDFQGTDAVLARAGREVQAAEIGQLLIEMLRQQLQSQLGDLLNDGRGPKKSDAQVARADSMKKAIQTAESENRRGFRVTRVELSEDLQSAIVTTQFVARIENDSWRPIFQHTERADAKQARPDMEQRIQNDPQVKQVLELTQKLGVNSSAQIQQAIRFGAAVMMAQQTCDREFASFRDVYLLSLARPPLSLTIGNR